MHSSSNSHPLPTPADVDNALAGIGVSQAVWSMTNQAYDSVAWAEPYASIEGRKARALEAARLALAECRKVIAEGSEATLERLTYAEFSKRFEAPKGDGWLAFSKALFRLDDVYADCPKAHETAIASLLHRRKYDLPTVRAILDHCALLHTAEDCPLVRDEDRAAVEQLLPSSPDSVWDVFSKFTWATNDLPAAVGQPA